LGAGYQCCKAEDDVTRILLVFLIAVACLAQTISSVTVDAVTHTTARVNWATDSSADSRLYYQLKSGSCPAAASLTHASATKGASTTHGITIGALKPASVYCYAPHSGATFGTVAEFTTSASPADRFAGPVLPTNPIPAIPAITGTTYTVDASSDCNGANGLQAKLDAAAAVNNALNHEVVIPAGSRCIGQYKLATRVGTGWIVVHTSATAGDTFTPVGVRTSPLWESAMAVMSNPTLDVWEGSGALEAHYPTGSSKWRFIGIEFTHEAFPMTGEFYAITGATNASPIEITTASAHGWASTDVVQIYGVGGNTAANGSRAITSTGASTFTIGVAGNANYTTGGYVVRNPSYQGAFISLDYGSSEIILDRCYVHGLGFPYRYSYGVTLHCANCGVINSHLAGITYWRGVSPADTNGFVSSGTTVNPGVIDISWGSPIIDNNYIEMGNGVTVFAQESPTVPHTTDIAITRNYFYGPPSLRFNTTNNAGVSDGRYYQHRQFLEFKRGERILVDGNVFENQWSDNVTGGFTIVLTPRVSDVTKPYSATNVIRDLTISNNTIKNAGGGIGAAGTDSDASGDTPAGARWRIANNLFYNIDGLYWVSNQAVGGDLQRGIPLQFGGTFEDFTWSHNTFWDPKGKKPEVILFEPGRSGGVQIDNNVFANHHTVYAWGFTGDGTDTLLPQVAYGSADPLTRFQGLMLSTPDVDTFSWFRHNVMVPGVHDVATPACWASSDTTNCNYNKASCATYWTGFTGIVCAGNNAVDDGSETATQRMASVKYVDATNGDFRLRYDSPYTSGGANRASDGSDMGVKMATLEVAQGVVRNVRVLSLAATSAAIHFLAPDVIGCPVDYGTDATFASYARAANAGGARVQSVALSGLTTGTTYHYRVLCQVQQPVGSFVTP
jgi:hypothetical protein